MNIILFLDKVINNLGLTKLAPGTYQRLHKTGEAYFEFCDKAQLPASSKTYLHLIYLDLRHGTQFSNDLELRRSLLHWILTQYPIFDSVEYALLNPDILAIHKDRNTYLDHFVAHGWKEERYLSHGYRLKAYDESHQDTSSILKRLIPLSHSEQQFLIEEINQLTTIKQENTENNQASLIPDAQRQSITPHKAGELPHSLRLIDIIIPVYADFELTKITIETLLSSKNITPHNILILNDKSPEPAITRYLRKVAQQNPAIKLIENADNKGFVKTVNHGFRKTRHDVVILNSDIELSDFWLDRLVWHAANQSRVGTITPFSNNATICSFPVIGHENPRLGEQSTGAISDALFAANRGKSCKIPTGVGFCMYISRELLDTVGLFDEEAFKRGYGEENDLCARAEAAGFSNLHALDVFVYHKGGASFSTLDLDPNENMPALLGKHPDFLKEVATAFREDPSKSSRIRGIWSVLRNTTMKKVLYIVHSLGGGTLTLAEQDIKEQKEGFAILLQPKTTPRGEYHITVQTEGTELLNTEVSEKGAIELLSFLRPDEAHIHHTIFLSSKFISSLANSGFPIDIYVHDLYWICPHIFGLPPQGSFCGFPDDTNECTKCLALTDPPNQIADTAMWRHRNKSVLSLAREVVIATNHVHEILERTIPGPNYVVKEQLWQKVNEEMHWRPRNKLPVKAKGRPVAILGTLAERKGLELMLAIKNELDKKNIDLLLIGYTDGNSAKALKQTGRYKLEDLFSIFDKHNPAAIWIPSVAIETYSLTLSEALASGYPVIVNNMEVLPERASAYDATYAVEHRNEPGKIALQIEDILEGRQAPLKNSHKEKRGKRIPSSEVKAPAINKKTKPLVSVALSTNDTTTELGYRMPDACAYVRLLAPLSNLENDFRFSFLTEQDSFTENVLRESDLFVTNRIGLGTERNLDLVREERAKRNVELLLDIDDLLFSMHDDHPDGELYATSLALLKATTEESDHVICSTPELGNYVADTFNKKTTVIRNTIQAEWFNAAKTSREEKPLHICYYGTNSHIEDWKMIESAVLQLAAENKIHVTIAGILPYGTSPEHWPANMKAIHAPQYAQISYKGFCFWLSNILKPDIGLAPLTNNKFNQAKSELKALEIAASGALPIYSAGFAYDVLADKKGSFGISIDDQDSWYDTLSELAQSPKQVTSEAVVLRKNVLKNFNTGKTKGSWRHLLNTHL